MIHVNRLQLVSELESHFLVAYGLRVLLTLRNDPCKRIKCLEALREMLDELTHKIKVQVHLFLFCRSAIPILLLQLHLQIIQRPLHLRQYVTPFHFDVKILVCRPHLRNDWLNRVQQDVEVRTLKQLCDIIQAIPHRQDVLLLDVPSSEWQHKSNALRPKHDLPNQYRVDDI